MIDSLRAALSKAERAHVVLALQTTGGRKLAAARLLRVSRKHVWQKIRDYAIEPAEYCVEV